MTGSPEIVALPNRIEGFCCTEGSDAAAERAAEEARPGPVRLYIVSIGYFVAGVPGAIAGWLSMITSGHNHTTCISQGGT